MDSPKRLRRSNYRALIPPGAKLVAAPSKFKNPFRDPAMPLAERLRRFEFEYLVAHPELVALAKTELRGLDLVCYCPLHQPCHADIWLRIVNS